MKLVVDSFAGGGGASLGIELALGRSPDIAINHDAEAVALHRANHPGSRHYCEDVWQVDPHEACGDDPVGLFWLSPDCTHFSKAKGGKPVKKAIRALAWVAVRWAKAKRPDVIVLENVEEFEGWGPVLRSTNRPCPIRKGQTFRAFVRALRRLGYAVEWRPLRACDYGAPTSRRRLFLIARCDGQPICWPAPTHGPGRAHAWRVAAECIEWSITCPSIFDRKKPLAHNTLRRIARGIRRFVIESSNPFVVGRAAHTLIQMGYGERPGQAPRVPGLDKPLGTVVSGGRKHGLVSAFLAKHYGGHETPGSQLSLPIDTITARDHHALVSAFLVAYYGTDQNTGSLVEPMATVTSKDRWGLVTIDGVGYAIADIGMRMLVPRELYRGQGFPDTYKIEISFRGKPLTRTAQVRMCGNSVPPPLVEAIVRANMDLQIRERAA